VNQKKLRRADRPTLPELDQTKRSVLNSLPSLQSRRSYRYAMDEFIDWYCSEPRLALNRGVVLGYRMQLESKKLAPATINVRLAAVHRLAYEAADTGLLIPELVAGIRRVKGVPQLGRRVGNWLTASEGEQLLSCSDHQNLRGKRDTAMISLLLGCGLRRSEVAGLKIGDLQHRENHWAIVDLVGKAGHVRTVPVPTWSRMQSISGGKVFHSPVENCSGRYGKTAQFGATV
jgi:integrase